jgi:sec-independent protein translocase protein TatB
MLPNGWEFIILVVLAVFLLGPDRMPEYAAKLARFVVHARRMANDAKGQLKEQMGPEFEDVNWRQYDPRQYDPRRIVRQALLEPIDDAVRDVKEIGASTRADLDDLSQRRDGEADATVAATGEGAEGPGALPVPYDVDAT